MKRKFLAVGMAFMICITVGARSWADEAAPAEAKPDEAKPAAAPAGAPTLDDIKKLLGLSIYLQGGYTYNFEGSSVNNERIFDQKANTFLIDLAEIQFQKDPAVGGVGFKLKVSAGETAKYIHASGLGNTDQPFDLTEAYISYVAPLGQGLRFDFGKFVTFVGAEVIEARDDPNYSRSFLFNYAEPLTHTGLKAGYTFSEKVNAAVYLVNGWDDFDDNNNGKTVGLSVGYTPIEQIALNFNFLYGPEIPNDNADNRFLFDWVGTLKPVKDLTVILNTDYATEQHSGPDGSTGKWYGISGIAKYDFSKPFSLSLRAEYFNDQDGLRTGTVQQLSEITLTPEIRLAAGIILRPEYRHDWSTQPVFPDADNQPTKKSQDTIALGIMYTW
jgi:hypothetical protein